MESYVPALVYSVVDTKKNAKKIAHVLVEEKLAACVNIVPKIISVYRWKGTIEEGQEYLLLAKTTEGHVKQVIQKIKEHHPYEIPAIVVLPIIGGLKDYLTFIVDETK